MELHPKIKITVSKVVIISYSVNHPFDFKYVQYSSQMVSIV